MKWFMVILMSVLFLIPDLQANDDRDVQKLVNQIKSWYVDAPGELIFESPAVYTYDSYKSILVVATYEEPMVHQQVAAVVVYKDGKEITFTDLENHEDILQIVKEDLRSREYTNKDYIDDLEPDDLLFYVNFSGKVRILVRKYQAAAGYVGHMFVSTNVSAP